ncbi:c-type cytochrome [Chenggangzhangella methanolivorans]|uniref:c-type cytochrome n=1 Tax=Chenggangzhangella methanolivorans TaxID=1437009 RepID=UPI0021BDEF24|nr:cytochrome C [Chenggangzhangella methanolivorans]
MAAFVAVAFGLPAFAAEPTPPGATSCSGCHAAGSAFGPLAGVPAERTEAALAAFRSGERPSTLMGRIAKGFDENQSRAIAQWWAGQEAGK